jgi:mono/diheme cytochrome c family protein
MRALARVPSIAVALFVATAVSRAEDAPGQKLFGADCGLCHQRTGEGVPGQFPRLAGRLGVIASTPEGRAYIGHVLANGMSGTVSVDGKTIVGYMPAFRQVPPADAAAILTYVSGLGGTSSVTFTQDEVAEARKNSMSPQAVHEERTALVAKKVVP